MCEYLKGVETKHIELNHFHPIFRHSEGLVILYELDLMNSDYIIDLKSLTFNDDYYKYFRSYQIFSGDDKIVEIYYPNRMNKNILQLVPYDLLYTCNKKIRILFSRNYVDCDIRNMKLYVDLYKVHEPEPKLYKLLNVKRYISDTIFMLDTYYKTRISKCDYNEIYLIGTSKNYNDELSTDIDISAENVFNEIAIDKLKYNQWIKIEDRELWLKSNVDGMIYALTICDK